MIKAESKSSGNIFLFGEHAVVYHKPAIIGSVGLYTKCTINKLKNKEIIIYSKELGKAFCKNNIRKGKKDLFPLIDLCNFLLKKFKLECGLKIKIESQIPVASGLSSSSAVLCSILHSFFKLFKLKLKNKNYYEYLIDFQKEIHGGKASGSEIISSSLGGLNYIYFHKNKLKYRQIKKRNKLIVVMGDTKIKTKTSKTVSFYIPELIKKNRRFINKSFNKIKLICEQSLPAFKKNDLIKLGQLLTKNQEILKSLGLSHPKIDSAIKKALDAGAFGAKLSGKGQGGIMFALTDEKNKFLVASAIKKSGLATKIIKIGV
jgi:mevalonate kinase